MAGGHVVEPPQFESDDIRPVDRKSRVLPIHAAYDVLMSRGLDVPFIIVSGRTGEEAARERAW